MTKFLLQPCTVQVLSQTEKNVAPSLQPPGHRCVAVAYLSSASANHLPDSDLR